MSAHYEASWFWRRLVTISLLIVCHVIVGAIVWFLRDAAALKWIGLALVGEAVIAYAAYIMGATVSEWAKIAAAAVPGLKITPFGARTAAVPASETPVDPNK